MLVDLQVDITFDIGKYTDTICLDVVPMEDAHLLLGRSWQFDRDAHHNGRTNKYQFQHHGKQISLAPLTPQQVAVDQEKLRELREMKRKESGETIDGES